MATPDNVLNKIKLLLNLAASPSNDHEASTAKQMADNLIAKYNVSEEELASLNPKPLYGEDEKLFHTVGLIPWKSQLALAIAVKYDCYIIQEETIPADGAREYAYFVYGDNNDIALVKYVYELLSTKVDYLIATQCVGRGEIYISSYCEGAVQSIKSNLQYQDFELPKSKLDKKEEEVKASSQIVKNKEVKEKPLETKTDIASQSMIKDIRAFFKGMEDGRDILINLLDANEELKILDH